ncbi:hypothetical protein [Brevibacillus massiliensis]|uniref:hypothetical protein n=1 Tax=Brevibacillus massiliensis TaxID=1118054 RepID=UPI00031ED431|nr:hypothetical protein [Brevibacillus massiliensis]
MIFIDNRVPTNLVGVIQRIAGQTFSSHAGKAHYELIHYLEHEAFFCESEHSIYYPDGRVERIDIMAHRDGEILAIEVDARMKNKSVKRLLQLEGGGLYRVIVLLHGTCSRIPEGIHAILRVNVN